MFQAAEFVAGLSTILVTLTTTYTPLVIYVIAYGLSDGFFFTSLSFILLTASPLRTDARSAWMGNDADVSFLGQWSSFSGYGQ